MIATRLVATFDHRQLPRPRNVAVAQDVSVTLRRPNFEIPMVRCEPAIEHFVHFDESVAEPEATGCLLASVARVALDGNREWLVAHTLITPGLQEGRRADLSRRQPRGTGNCAGTGDTGMCARMAASQMA